MISYRPPTDLEQAFVRVVTHGYPDLQSQIPSFQIAEYDSLGWCHIHVLTGKPSQIRHNAEGPLLRTGRPDVPLLGTIMWTDCLGMLESIEIVEYGIGQIGEPPYRLFVDAAAASPSQLQYAESHS
jgi:hypothetical protein